jgi:four helix bundle protein
MASRNYRDLVAWQRAMDLVEVVYVATRKFPKEEQYGLTIQMKRASVSVPSNIAEGQGRGNGKEFARFLKIAYGSLREIETQAEIAFRLGFADRSTVSRILSLAGDVGRLINGLIKSQEP